MNVRSRKTGNAIALFLLACVLMLVFPFTPFIVSADDAFTKPVSVTFPNTLDGSFSSHAVSVSFADSVLADGTIPSNAVSVSWPTGFYTDMFSQSVSVVIGSYLGIWHMDDNWLDSSGNGNNGTAYGAAAFDRNGRSGSAGAFNGSGAYVDAGSSSTLRAPYSLSLETWVKLNQGVTGVTYIAGNTDEATMTGYGLFVSETGVVRMKIGNGAWSIVNGTTVLTPGIWYHVAGTYSGDKVRLYVNGALESEASAPAVITYKNPFRIGHMPGSSGLVSFSGLIDELVVYNRALPASEIAVHYTTGKLDTTPPAPPTVNPVVSPTASSVLTLSGTKEADSSMWVNSTKIVERDNATTWQGTYTLKSAVNVLSVTAVDASDNQSVPTTLTVILDDKPPVIESSVPANNSDTAKLVSNVTINLIDTYSSINLTASINGATVKSSASQAISGSWTTSGTKTLVFTPTNPFPLDTYTATIYPVDSLGNIGLQQIIFTNHDITPPVTTVTLNGNQSGYGWYSSSVNVTMAASDGPEGSGADKIEYSFDNSAWNVYTAPFIVDKDGITTIYYRSSDKAGNVETAESADVRINKTGLVGLWHMDNDWKDSSYLGNHGTPYSGATFSTQSKVGSDAGSFDGANDYVSIPDSSSLSVTSAITVSAWVNQQSEAPGKAIIAKWTFGSQGSWALQTHGSDASRLYVFIADSLGDTGNNYGSTPVGSWSSGVWHHVAFTFDGAGATDADRLKVFIDGVQQTLTFGGAIPSLLQDSTAPIRIGDFEGLSRFWNGLIDEVVIYNRALSAEEITEQYLAAYVPPPTVDPVPSPTASETITLSGTKQADTSIKVNGAEFVPLDGLTSWQGTYNLQPGVNTLNITATDAEGKQSQAVAITVVFDNGAPQVTTTTPANNASLNTPINSITFTLSDSYGALDLAATVDGATVRNSSGQDIPGGWTISGNTVIFTPTNPFVEEAYTVTINPTDALGNKTTSQIVFSYDVTAPSAPSMTSVVSPTNKSSQTVTGARTSDAVSVIVSSSTAKAGTVTYPSPITWSAVISNLIDGPNTISAYAKDAAGNASAAAAAVIVYDSTAPAAPAVDAVISPTRNSSVVLTGTKEPETAIIINGVLRVAINSSTVWSYTYALSEGQNNLGITARDAAGNDSAPVNVTIIYDKIPPVLTLDVDGDYLYAAHGSANPYLSVFSLADPQNPVRLSTYGGGAIDAFDAEGSLGIGLTGNSSLVSLSYAGSSFSKLSDIVLPRSAVKSVELRGQYALYSSGLDGWGLMEISGAGALTDMGTVRSGDSANRVLVRDGHVYSADGTGGLRIYKIESLNTQPPSVSITSPISGTSVSKGSEVEITADVTNGDGALVTFFVNGKELFTDKSSPYSCYFRVPGGVTTLTLKARAYNLAGIYSDSQVAVLNVVENGSPPTITITSATSGGGIPGLFEENTLSINDGARDNAVVVDVLGDIAVTGSSNGTVGVYDISSSDAPVFTGSLNLDGYEIMQVRIIGSRVYAASGPYMKIIDITNPASPVQLSSTVTGWPYSIDVFDNIAFTGTYGYVYVYDVNNVQGPIRKSYKYLGGGYVQDVKVDGLTKRLYAAVDNGTNSYLSVLDTGNVNGLVEIGRVSIPGNPKRMEIAGDKAYIAVGTGMVVLSLSRLGTADFGKDGNGDGRADDILSYTATTTGGATDVFITGNHAYLADGYNGVKLIDITDPTAPEEMAEMDTYGYDAVELEIIGNYLYLANGYGGFKVIRLY